MKEVSDTAKTQHVIVIISYSTLQALNDDVLLEETGDKPLLHDSILRPDWTWSMVFVDEAHYLRNPQSLQSLAVLRILAKAEVVVGATATLVWNSPLDPIEIFKTLLHPAVRRTLPGTGTDKVAQGDYSLLVHQIRLSWGKLGRERREAVTAALGGVTTAQIMKMKGDARVDMMTRARALEDEFMSGDLSLPPPDKDRKGKKKARPSSAWLDDLRTQVIEPVASIVMDSLVRRTKESRDMFGDPIIEIPDYTITDVKVVPTTAEVAAQEAFKMSLDKSQAENFQIKLRQYAHDPQNVETGFFDITTYPSAKMRTILAILGQIDRDNTSPEGIANEALPKALKYKPVAEQEKIVISVLWTSLVPVILARLAQHGFHAAAITGETPLALRARIIAEFQKDADHLSTPVAFTVGVNDVHVSEPTRCRILLITSVASAGVNLFRGSVMILTDLSFTKQEEAQIIGRIARRGQKLEPEIYRLTSDSPTDKWLLSLSSAKGAASEVMFGGMKATETKPLTFHDVDEESQGGTSMQLPAGAVARTQHRHDKRKAVVHDQARKRLKLAKLPRPKMEEKEKIDKAKKSGRGKGKAKASDEYIDSDDESDVDSEGSDFDDVELPLETVDFEEGEMAYDPHSSPLKQKHTPVLERIARPSAGQSPRTTIGGKRKVPTPAHPPLHRKRMRPLTATRNCMVKATGKTGALWKVSDRTVKLSGPALEILCDGTSVQP